jgi:HSP20 family molecular chaperone IbpA
MRRVIYLRRPGTGRDEQGLQQQLERVFQRQWGQAASVIVVAKNREVWHPPADVYETEESFLVKVELPGMRDAEIEVTLEERGLHISGSRPEQRSEGLRYYHQMGINYGRFELEVFLARPVDHNSVTAHYDDGFLLVELPKPAKQPQSGRITVQVTE